MRPTLAELLTRPYPFVVVPEPDGEWFVAYPDLPGCMTQVERPEEIGPMAEEIRTLWLETAHDHGIQVPSPSDPAAVFEAAGRRPLAASDRRPPA